MKTLLVIFSLLCVNLLVAQNCPFADDKYNSIWKKERLTEEDKKYVKEVDKKCAEYLMPTYLTYPSWERLFEENGEGYSYVYYYDNKSYLKNDSIISVWICNDFTLDGFKTEIIDISGYVFFLSEKTYTILGSIAFDEETREVIFADAFQYEIKNIKKNSIEEKIFNHLKKAKN